ncbi:MAG: hypothetical protein R2795_21620 [Saprospiraceae bacterium]
MEMRHYTNYFRSYPGIKEFRQALVTTDCPETIFRLLDEIEQTYSGVEVLVP